MNELENIIEKYSDDTCSNSDTLRMFDEIHAELFDILFLLNAIETTAIDVSIFDSLQRSVKRMRSLLNVVTMQNVFLTKKVEMLESDLKNANYSIRQISNDSEELRDTFNEI